MKLVKIVDQKGANIVSDPLNQNILRELVSAERSASELAAKFNIPLLNLWRRMQKMEKANLIELTKTKKAGNIEKKLYRHMVRTQRILHLQTQRPLSPRSLQHLLRHTGPLNGGDDSFQRCPKRR